MAKNNLLSDEEIDELHTSLRELQEAFPYTVAGFLLFAQTIINTLIVGNPSLNRVQADICRYLLTGNKYRMIQAYRGAAKTTITAIYACFMLIHKPHLRVVIFSQSGKRAKEISGWVVKIFRRIDFLEFMQPDESAGDRASVEAFDIHYAIKDSVDKSPSVACQSIEAGAQGMRADILIADDVESLQNSRTVAGRELLEEITKEFESINQTGEIIYLGTPQSVNSIYNNLPARGYDIRIWPSRYPTVAELSNYGSFIAPMFLDDIQANPALQLGGGLTGSQGQPTCPEMFPEEILQEKELSQGKAKFQLQYMLNTRLADEDRYPLKLTDLVVAPYSVEEAPVMPVWASGSSQIINTLPKVGNRISDKFYACVDRQYEWQKFERKVMYIDPAGGGKNSGDEMAFAVVGLVGTFVYILALGGVKGGYGEDSLMALVNVAKRTGCKTVHVEKNFGNGAHVSMLSPLFEAHWHVDIEEVWESGQKELRIIDVLEPVISSHRLVISEEVIQYDFDSVANYPAELRPTYMAMHQLSNITREKDCLRHDDRLDALAGAVRAVVKDIDYDMQAARLRQQQHETKEWLKMMNNPIARRESVTGVAVTVKPQSRNMFSRRR